MTDEEKVKAKWPKAELGYSQYGVRVVSIKSPATKWFQTRCYRLSDTFYTASEAWADAARRLEQP